MKKISRRILMMCSLLLVCLGVLHLSAPLVRAESGINSAEQRVIQAARATFKYRGKYYKAKPEYFAKGVTYLKRDDVDLTEAEASEAISQMKWNVGEGVIRGYLYEVQPENEDQWDEEVPSEEPKPTSPSQEGTNEDTTDEKPSTQKPTPTSQPSGGENQGSGTEEQENIQSVPGSTGNPSGNNGQNNNGQASNGQNTGGQEADVPSDDSTGNEEIGSSKEDWQFIDEILEGDIVSEGDDEVLAGRPNKEDASLSFEYDMETGTLLHKNEGSTSAIEGGLLPSWMRTGSIAFVGILTVVLVGVAGMLASKSCFTFQTREKRQHKERRNLRKRLRPVVTVVVALNLLLLFGSSLAQIALFNDDSIIQNLNTSGFYRNTYEVVYIEAQEILTKYEIEPDTLEEVLTYEQYVVAGKNKTLSILGGKEDESTLSSMETQVTTALRGMTNAKEAGEEIMTAYRKMLAANISRYIYDLKKECRSLFLVVVPVAVVNLILGIGMLYFMDRFRHRGTRSLAYAVGITTAVFAIGTTVLMTVKPYTKVYISPDYLYKFFVSYMNWGLKIMTIMSGFGVIFLLILLGLAKKQRQGKRYGVN